MKKIYLLILGLLIFFIPIFIFSENLGNKNVKTYRLSFIASQNISSTAYGLEGKDGNQFKIKAGELINLKNKLELNYYYKNELISFSKMFMPKEDIIIYVDRSSFLPEYYPADNFKKKPKGYVTISLDAGKHGDFIYFDKDNNKKFVKILKYYVPSFKEINLFGAAFVPEIEKGYELKNKNNFDIENSYDKSLKGLFTKDQTLTAQYQKKEYTHTFMNSENNILSKIKLPAQAKFSELKDFAKSLKIESPGKDYKFYGWQEGFKDNKGKIQYIDNIINFEENYPKDDPLNSNKYFKPIWSKGHLVKFYMNTGQLIDYEFVEDGNKLDNKKIDPKVKYFEIIDKTGTYDLENGNLKDFKLEKKTFDLNTPIYKDLNIMAQDNQFLKPVIFISTFPKKEYLKNEEIDLTGLVVGLNKDENTTIFIPYEDFDKYGIKVEPKQGTCAENLNGKSIKITKGDYFTFSEESFNVSNSKFEKYVNKKYFMYIFVGIVCISILLIRRKKLIK